MFLTSPDTSYACPSRQDNTFFIGIIFLLGIIGVTAYGIYHPPIFVAVGVMFFFLSFSGLCGLAMMYRLKNFHVCGVFLRVAGQTKLHYFSLNARGRCNSLPRVSTTVTSLSTSYARCYSLA